MIRIGLSTILLSLSCAALAQQIEPDTLLTAKTANSLSVVNTKSSTTITVKGLDGGADNFYYQSGRQRGNSGEQTQLNYDGIVAPLVVEHDTGVAVSFSTTDNSSHSYMFSFPDPANRRSKSYTGRRGSDFGFVLSRNSGTEWEAISCGLGLGWVTPVSSSTPMDVSMGRSVELTWLMMLGVRMRHKAHSLSMGLGLDWRNLVTKGDYFKSMDNGAIIRLSYEAGASNVRSRIKVFSLQVPILYGLNFGRNQYCGLRIGPVVCFNTSSSIKTQYELEGEKYTVKTGNIGQRPVTVDAFLSFNYRAIGLYARYSPMKLMRDRTGLDFNTFSTGIMFGF